MKKNVSLFNDEPIEKKQIKNIQTNFFLKPQYFAKFSNETLFYIFYYMPRDMLQIHAAEELQRRKWKYNTDYAIWFTQESSETEKQDKLNDTYYYFNPTEWKKMKYAYAPLNQKSFLPDSEVFKFTNKQQVEK